MRRLVVMRGLAALGLLVGTGILLAQELPPAPLSVRAGRRVQTVATMRHPDGSTAVRADALAEALGGRAVFEARQPQRLRLEVGGVGLQLEIGSAFALVAGDTVPLSSEVIRQGGRWYVPLTVVSDLLPRSGAGVLYDEARREVRRFTPTVGPTVARPRASSTAGGGDSRPVPRTALKGQRVVVVDAGHGGPDNGMSGPLGASRKVAEKHVTLAVAKALDRALEARGVSVVMTRTTDTLIALADRGKIANQAHADLFLSIHVNAANPRWANPGAARGFETYFLAEAQTEDERRVAAMENEAIRFETTVDASRDDPLGFIIRDMAQNEHLRESARLAELISGGMRTVHPGPNRGVRQAGFRVLVSAFMPAVLVEIGYGTNRAEVDYMTDPRQQAALAESIADAVVRYLAQYERKVGGS